MQPKSSSTNPRQNPPGVFLGKSQNMVYNRGSSKRSDMRQAEGLQHVLKSAALTHSGSHSHRPHPCSVSLHMPGLPSLICPYLSPYPHSPQGHLSEVRWSHSLFSYFLSSEAQGPEGWQFVLFHLPGCIENAEMLGRCPGCRWKALSPRSVGALVLSHREVLLTRLPPTRITP
jgi:hypothetical protein